MIRPDRPGSARRRRRAAVSLMMVCAVALTACSKDEEPAPAKPDDPADTASSRDADTLQQASPTTGIAPQGGLPAHQVFVVKIENTDNGAPQSGLDRADVVFEELVEGGITRLAAFFYEHTPTKIAHVRSVRSSDIDIVKPTRGYLVGSGGAGITVRRIDAAGVDLLSEDTGNLTLKLDPAKSAPYNRIFDLGSYVEKSPKADPPPPYFDFGPASAFTGAKAAKQVAVTFSPSSTTQWKFGKGAYTRQNGHAAQGEEFEADNILVLRTRQTDAGYRDPAGNPVPETDFTGSGKATLIHGGKAVGATWHKRKPGSHLTLTTGGGTRLDVPAGRTWVELIPVGDGAISLTK